MNQILLIQQLCVILVLSGILQGSQNVQLPSRSLQWIKNISGRLHQRDCLMAKLVAGQSNRQSDKRYRRTMIDLEKKGRVVFRPLDRIEQTFESLKSKLQIDKSCTIAKKNRNRKKVEKYLEATSPLFRDLQERFEVATEKLEQRVLKRHIVRKECNK